MVRIDLIRTLRDAGLGIEAITNANVRRGFRERFERQDPRGGRSWELVAILRGSPMVETRTNDWVWIKSAVLHHLK